MLRHRDSTIDAMDLVEGGVGQCTCFCKGSPASKLDSRQDMVPHLQFLGWLSMQEMDSRAGIEHL